MGLPLGLAKGEPRPITESNTDPQGPGPGFTAPRARRGGLRSGVGRWTPDGKRTGRFSEWATDAGRLLHHARKRIFEDPARAFVEAVSIVQADRQAERAVLFDSALAGVSLAPSRTGFVYMMVSECDRRAQGEARHGGDTKEGGQESKASEGKASHRESIYSIVEGDVKPNPAWCRLGPSRWRREFREGTGVRSEIARRSFGRGNRPRLLGSFVEKESV